MAEETVQTTPKTFSGNQNLYTIIATRDAVSLGLNLQLATASQMGNLPVIVARFAAIATDSEKFEIEGFEIREFAPFVYGADTVPGYRLNRLVLKTFDGTMPKGLFVEYGDKFDLWSKIGEWLMEQVVEAAFMPTHAVYTSLVRGFFELPPTDPSIKCIIELPSLAPKKVIEEEPASDEAEDLDDEDAGADGE